MKNIRLDSFHLFIALQADTLFCCLHTKPCLSFLCLKCGKAQVLCLTYLVDFVFALNYEEGGNKLTHDDDMIG